MDGPALAAHARRAESMGTARWWCPTTWIEQLAPVPAMATIAAATRPCAPARSCSTTTCATRRSWPRTSPPSTCCAAGGWTSRWARGGAARVRRDGPAVRPRRPARGAARGSGRRAQGLLRGWPVRLRRPLHDHRLRRPAEAGPAAASAVAHRRRWAADADASPLARRTSWALLRGSSGVSARTPEPHLRWRRREKIGWVREAAGDRFDDLSSTPTHRRGRSP